MSRYYIERVTREKFMAADRKWIASLDDKRLALALDWAKAEENQGTADALIAETERRQRVSAAIKEESYV